MLVTSVAIMRRERRVVHILLAPCVLMCVLVSELVSSVAGKGENTLTMFGSVGILASPKRLVFVVAQKSTNGTALTVHAKEGCDRSHISEWARYTIPNAVCPKGYLSLLSQKGPTKAGMRDKQRRRIINSVKRGGCDNQDCPRSPFG